MSTPYRFGHQSGHPQQQYSLPAPRVAKAPIHNPYDKFTQQEFDAWIGGITSSLKRALGEEELAKPPPISDGGEDSSSEDDEHVASQLLEDEDDDESIDGEANDTFAELRALRVSGKGKARDPREGPGLGKGDQAQPIEILSDSEEEEQASPPAQGLFDELGQDEDVESGDYEEEFDEGEEDYLEDGEGEEEYEEEEEEAGLPPWDNGESSAQAALRHLYQKEQQSLQPYTEDYEDYEDEGSPGEEEYSEGEDEDGVYEDDQPIHGPGEDVPHLRQHARMASQSPDDDVILVNSSDEEQEAPVRRLDDQQLSDAEYSDELYEDEQGSPLPAPIQRERISESPEGLYEPQSSPAQFDEDLPHEVEEEEEEEEEEDVDLGGKEEDVEDVTSGADYDNQYGDAIAIDDVEEESRDDIGPADEEMDDDVIEVVDDDDKREQTPNEAQPLADDTSFPPYEPFSAREEAPLEIPDPWIGPRTYAEDYYSGGELHFTPGVVLDPDLLGPEIQDRIQDEDRDVFQPHVQAHDIEMAEEVSNSLEAHSPPPTTQDGLPTVGSEEEEKVPAQLQPPTELKTADSSYPQLLDELAKEPSSVEEEVGNPIGAAADTEPSLESGGVIDVDVDEEQDETERQSEEANEQKGEGALIPASILSGQDAFLSFQYPMEKPEQVPNHGETVPEVLQTPATNVESSLPEGQSQESGHDFDYDVFFDMLRAAGEETPAEVSSLNNVIQQAAIPQHDELLESAVERIEPGVTVPTTSVQAEEAVLSSTPPPVLASEQSEGKAISPPRVEVPSIEDDIYGESQLPTPPADQPILEVQIPTIAVIEVESEEINPPPSLKLDAAPEPPSPQFLASEIQINVIEATPEPSPLLRDLDEMSDELDANGDSVEGPDLTMDWLAGDFTESHVVVSYGVEEIMSEGTESGSSSEREESPEKTGIEVLEEVQSTIDEYFSLDGYGEEDVSMQDVSVQEVLEAEDKTGHTRDASVLDHLYEDLRGDSLEGLDSGIPSDAGHSSRAGSPSLLSQGQVPTDEAEVPSNVGIGVFAEEAVVSGDRQSVVLDIPSPTQGSLPPDAEETLAPPDTSIPVPEEPPMVIPEELPTPTSPVVAESAFEDLTGSVDDAPRSPEVEQDELDQLDQSQTTIAEGGSPAPEFGVLSSETKVESMFASVSNEKEEDTVAPEAPREDPLSPEHSETEHPSPVDDASEGFKGQDPTPNKEISPTASHRDDTSDPVDSDLHALPISTPILEGSMIEDVISEQEPSTTVLLAPEKASTSAVEEPTRDVQSPCPVQQISEPEFTDDSTPATAEDDHQTRPATGTPTEGSEVVHDQPVVGPPKTARKSTFRKETGPDASNGDASRQPIEQNGPSSHFVFSLNPEEEGIPVQMFSGEPRPTTLMSDPFPYNLSTPQDYSNVHGYLFYNADRAPSGASAPSISDIATANPPPVAEEPRDTASSQEAPHPAQADKTISHNDIDAEGDADPDYAATPTPSTEATTVAPRLLTMRSPTQIPRTYPGMPYSKSNKANRERPYDPLQSSPLSSISGSRPTINDGHSEAEDVLPSILIIKKPSSPAKSNGQEKQEDASLKRKRESIPGAVSSATSKKPPAKPRGKKIKAESSQAQKKTSKPRKEKGKAKDPDVRSTSSRDSPSRASSIASSAPSDITRQASPSVASRDPHYRPLAPPPPRTMPPSLMHRHHSHALPQGNSFLQQRSSSQRNMATENTTPRSQAASHRERGSLSSYSSPVTRSNCRYHKISIPRDEDGPRIMFLVPGCTLGDQELIEEEEIVDLGDATVEDTRELIQDLDSLDFDPYLIGVLRQLVGAKMLQEREVYYMARKGEDGQDLISRKTTWNLSKSRSHLHYGDPTLKATESPTTPTGASFAGLEDIESSSASEEEEEEDEYRPPKKTRGTGGLARRATLPTPSTGSRGVKRTNTSVAHDQDLDAARQAKRQRPSGEGPIIILYNGPPGT